MKIVINAFSARRGGGQTYLLNLLQHLDSAHGVDVYVLTPHSLELPAHPAVTKLNIAWPTENPLLRTLWEKFRLPGLLKNIGADVLFCPGGLVNTRTSKKCKTVTMFRNMIPFDMAVRKKYPVGLMRMRNWLLEHSMLSSMMKADMVIFISDFARKVIEERSHGRIKHSVTIPHGISDHFRSAKGPDQVRPQWLPKGEYLLYVSIFDVYKNQLEIVRGYNLLKSRRMTREKLILAGHHSAKCALQVKEEILRLGLEDDVILTGNIPYQELPAVYAHAKINIFASTCENCPNILLEALGARRPVMVSEFKPMPEFGGDAVVYFNPLSPEDFAEKLEALIDDSAALNDYGERARIQADRFDWKLTAQTTWQMLASLK